jgi:hypothetical protein
MNTVGIRVPIRNIREFSTFSVRQEHRLRVFENSVLRRTFGPRKDKWREVGENCIMMSS